MVFRPLCFFIRRDASLFFSYHLNSHQSSLFFLSSRKLITHASVRSSLKHNMPPRFPMDRNDEFEVKPLVDSHFTHESDTDLHPGHLLSVSTLRIFYTVCAIAALSSLLTILAVLRGVTTQSKLPDLVYPDPFLGLSPAQS